jgi:hypothetical protein
VRPFLALLCATALAGGATACPVGYAAPAYSAPQVYAPQVFAAPVYAPPVCAAPVVAAVPQVVYTPPAVYAPQVFAAPQVYAAPAYAAPQVYAAPAYAAPAYCPPAAALPSYGTFGAYSSSVGYGYGGAFRQRAFLPGYGVGVGHAPLLTPGVVRAPLVGVGVGGAGVVVRVRR